MNSRRPFLLVLTAALVSACSVAPVMNPAQRLGLNRLPPQDPKTPAAPEKSAAQYGAFLKSQQYFEEPLLVYNKQLAATMDSLQKGGSAREVPLDGIPYFYFKHVAHMGGAYVGQAKAYLAAKDLPRAERAALNAIQLVPARGHFHPVVVSEVEEEAFKVLVDVYTEQGFPGNAQSAQLQREMRLDFMSSPDGLAAYQEFVKTRSEGQTQLKECNAMIAQLNAQKSAQTAALFAAGVAAAGSAMSSYQEASARADANRQGYMSADNAAIIQMAQMNRLNADMLFRQVIGKTGKWGDALTAVHSLASPQMFRQLTNPSAGVDPAGIMRAFAQRATKLGRGDLAITRHAAQLTAQTNNLEKARNSGDAKAKRAALESFLPALNKLTNDLKRVK